MLLKRNDLLFVFNLYMLNYLYKNFRGNIKDFERVLNKANSGNIRKFSKILINEDILEKCDIKIIKGKPVNIYKINKKKLIEFIMTLDEFKLCYEIILNETFVLTPELYNSKELDRELNNKFINNDILYIFNKNLNKK